MINGRTLDYVPRLDDRNRAHRIAVADPLLLERPRYWTGGVVLDQGQEGSCVGHGVVAEWLASPVRGRLAPHPQVSHAWDGHWLAVQVYNRAKQIDEWEGIDYEGTSVRAGMLVARERGWCTGFKWAFGMVELRAALEEGPVVVGIEVRDGMFHPTAEGDWIPDGPVAGGHCALVTGYSPNYARRGPRFRIRNSWGLRWGRGGNAYIAPADLDEILFKAGGEAAVPVGRAA